MVEVANASTAALSEVKQVEVTGLRPFFSYNCRLLKEVVHLNETIVHPQAIQLVTGETGTSVGKVRLSAMKIQYMRDIALLLIGHAVSHIMAYTVSMGVHALHVHMCTLSHAFYPMNTISMLYHQAPSVA